ncbi:MAG: hypothetical protein MRY83_12870 [Flavobacteriales bacterium]|nr:hypothetical protein [Flavobacteriales bacterium]
MAEDIKFIKTETEVDEIGGTFLGSIPFIFTLLLPWMLFMLFVFYKKNNQSNANKFDERSKKANKVATTRLTKAKEFVEKQDPSAFYDAIYQALFGYFSDRFNIPLSQLSISKIAEESGHHNIDESTINKLTNILNDCEMSKFAPLSNSDLQTVYSNTSGIITEIESSLK